MAQAQELQYSSRTQWATVLLQGTNSLNNPCFCSNGYCSGLSALKLENEVVKGRRENSAYAKKQFAALSAQLDGKYKQVG